MGVERDNLPFHVTNGIDTVTKLNAKKYNLFILSELN